jgi:hypothetical protein
MKVTLPSPATKEEALAVSTNLPDGVSGSSSLHAAKVARERRNAGDEIVEKFNSSFHNFSNFG